MKLITFTLSALVAVLHISLTLILAVGFLAFIVPGVLARQVLKLS